MGATDGDLGIPLNPKPEIVEILGRASWTTKGPVHVHDCKKCAYLITIFIETVADKPGPYEKAIDVYKCSESLLASVLGDKVFRFSDKDSDYTTLPEPWLRELFEQFTAEALE